MNGSKAEAAVADHNRSDAVPARNRAVRIPEDLRVVVGVKIDEAGRDDLPRRIDHARGVARAQAAYLGDSPVLDSDITAKPRHPGPVDYHSVANDRVEFRHRPSPPLIRGISAHAEAMALN